jgi:integrase
MRDKRIPSATPDNKMTKVPGKPGIFKKGNRYCDTFKENGKSRRRFYRTLAEAKRGRAERIASGSLPASRERFDRYAERWLIEYRGRKADGITAETREAYALLLRIYVIPYFRHTPVGDLMPVDIKKFIDHLAALAPKRPQRGATRLSPATVRRIMTPVKAMLTEAYELGLIRVNPTTVRIVVPGQQRLQVPRTLSAEQIADVLGGLAERDRLLFVFLARTGLRISEALAATWADLDQAPGGPVLRVPKSKTEAGVRNVAILPSLSRSLIRHRATSAFAYDAAPIFVTLTGTRQDANNVRRRLRPVAEAAGVPWATPHTFRHSLATEMRDRGYDMSVIAKVLGHSDPNFTRRTYVHIQDAPRFDDLDEAGPGAGTSE